MADSTKTLEIVLSARDEATKTIRSFQQSFSDLAKDATVGATLIAGALSLIAKGAINTASDFEQARVAFEGFLKDGDKAGKLLKDLSDFAVKTPFQLPQVVEGGKQLLAYGIEADKVVDTFRVLGDISQGQVGKLDRLVLAYGQVKAATRLTGAELRQFTEAGVPLLEALANELNKNGGAMVNVGTAAKKTKVDVGELNDKLSISKQRLAEATANAKTKKSTLMSLQNTVQNYEQKLSKANTTMGETSQKMVRMKVTAKDVQEMISDKAISFDQVNAALHGLTGEGGRFFNAMELQSHTLGGVSSNLGDEFIRFSITVLGLTSEGEVRQGSIFYYLKKGAEGLLVALQEIRPIAQNFVDSILNSMPAMLAIFGALLGILTPIAIAFWGMIAPALAFIAIGAALGAAIGLLVQGLRDGNPLAIGLTAALSALAVVILASVIPAFVAWAISAASAALATIVALWPIIAIITAIGVVVGLFAAAWNNNWLGIRDITQNVVNWFKNTVMPFFKSEFGEKLLKIIDMVSGGWITGFRMIRDAVNSVIDAIGALINKAKEMAEKVKGGLKIPGFQHGGFVPGGSGSAVPAILHGGERVIPRTGVDVNPGGGGITLSLNFTGPVSMDSGDRVKDLANEVIKILGRQSELAAKGFL